MRRLAVLALAVASAAAPARATAPAALAQAADALARDVGPPPEGRRGLLLAMEGGGALGPPLEAAISAALAARGYAVTPGRATPEAERAARAAGDDWVLRVRAGIVPGRRELALEGELIPAWASFFLQRRPEARAVPPRVVQGRAPADPETLLLARDGRGPAFVARIRTLARLPGRVLALAAGELDAARRTGVVAVTEDAVVVLGPDGARIASWRSDGALAPVRHPAATAAVGDFGGGRIAVRRAGAARADVLALAGDRLDAVGALDAAPLCAGDAGRLFGAFAPGTGVLQDLLSPLVDPAARPRSQRTLYGIAEAPHGGSIAYAVLGTDLRLELLGADLRPVGTAAPTPAKGVTGSGFALADLDGDGSAELVASSPEPGAVERIRVLSPIAGKVLLESEPIAGALLAGAAADLTGDGVDDAVLAAVRDDGTTDVLLVTGDPTEAP